jgi:O-antigen ligase
MALSAVLALTALLLTLSRGGIVGALVAGTVLMTWPRFRRAALTLLVVVALLAVAGVVPLARSPEAGLIATRVSSVFGAESEANPRIRLYEGTPQLIADHPLIGIGAGNFPVVSPLYGLRDRGAESFEHAHSIVLTIAAEAGLLGLGCFLAFLVALIRPAAVVLRSRRSPLYPVGIGAVAALAGLLATGILDFPLRSNLLTAFALIATGAIVAAARRAHNIELEA